MSFLVHQMKKAQRARTKKNFRKLKPAIKSHIRRYIMVTMIHNEMRNREKVRVQMIGDRFEELLRFNLIVIATETHADRTYHHHVGIRNANVYKNNCVEKIRWKFPEWEGRGINVSNQRSCKSILSYVTKVDKNPS